MALHVYLLSALLAAEAILGDVFELPVLVMADRLGGLYVSCHFSSKCTWLALDLLEPCLLVVSLLAGVLLMVLITSFMLENVWLVLALEHALVD